MTAPPRRVLHGAIIAAICSIAAAAIAQPAATGVIAGEVRVLDGSTPRADRSGIVVYLDQDPRSVPESARLQRAIRQRDRQFVPTLLVVPVGSTVDFPNDDRIFHNVFSLSRARRFDLGLYRAGESRAVTFPRPGVINLYCNIHPRMAARIVIVPTVHYAVTGRDGRFRIDRVPAGSYPVVGWQPAGDGHRSTVAVRAGATTRLAFDLRAEPLPTEHTRSDGTPYGRYR